MAHAVSPYPSDACVYSDIAIDYIGIAVANSTTEATVERRTRTAAVSYNELLVLQALSLGRQYGLEIMSLTELSAGTVYPILRRFEGNGYVESSREDEGEARAAGRPARRLYVITPSGVMVLAEAREELLARHRALGLEPGEA